MHFTTNTYTASKCKSFEGFCGARRITYLKKQNRPPKPLERRPFNNDSARILHETNMGKEAAKLEALAFTSDASS